MNILIANDSPTAMYYIRLSIARALNTLGHNVIIWDINKQSAFDAFDIHNPDVIFLQSYNLNSATIKCIKERPNLLISMRVSDWSKWRDELDPKYPVLKAGEKEIKFMEELQKLPNKMVCHIHHFEEYLEMTHGRWIENGFKMVSVPNCADIFDYVNGIYHDHIASDLTMIGGCWGYKYQTISKYVFPLLNPNENYNIKIFGNQAWSTSKYCGFLPNGTEKHVLKSAKICLNVHELHSQDFGYDAITRPYNCLANKCLVVSDYVKGLANRFTGMIHCKTPKEYKDSIDYYLNKPEEREQVSEIGYNEVMKDHTAYERIKTLWDVLDIDTDLIPLVKRQVLEKLCNL